MAKAKKVENPLRQFVVTLVTFFADIFTKPQREKLVAKSLGPIAGLFGFLSVFTLIYIILDEQEKDYEYENAKSAMVYVSFSFTIFIMLIIIGAIVTHKNLPLIRYAKI